MGCDSCADSIIDEQIIYSKADKFNSLDNVKDLQGEEHKKQVKQKVEPMKNANDTINVNTHDEKTHADYIGMKVDMYVCVLFYVFDNTVCKFRRSRIICQVDKIYA